MKRWVLGLDPVTEANLALRAKAHGVSRPEYVRALINGQRPGAQPGSLVAKADAWWDHRSPSRRVSIWRNHAAATTNGSEASQGVGQLSIEDALDQEGQTA